MKKERQGGKEARECNAFVGIKRREKKEGKKIDRLLSGDKKKTFVVIVYLR